MPMRMRTLLAATAALAAAMLACGCGGDYKRRTAAAREAFYAGDFEAAAGHYSSGAETEGKTQILYLMERGLVRRAAGDHAGSNADLLDADRLAEKMYFNKAAVAAATILFDERAAPYPGEDHELVLLSTYVALNFLALGDLEHAQIEARRIDDRLRALEHFRKRPYKQNAFARYLSGVIYERSGEIEEAYIDYKIVHELAPGFPPAREPLVRLSRALGFKDQHRRWRKEFPEVGTEATHEAQAQVVVFFENGRSPEKVSHDEVSDIPIFVRRPSAYAGAALEVGGRRLARTHVLEDIEATAIRNLKERTGPLIAKALARFAVKEGIAYGVGEAADDKNVANLARIILHLSDKADLRSWLTLPKELQIARAWVPAGQRPVVVRFLAPDGGGGEATDFGTVDLAPGKLHVLMARTLR